VLPFLLSSICWRSLIKCDIKTVSIFAAFQISASAPSPHRRLNRVVYDNHGPSYFLMYIFRETFSRRLSLLVFEGPCVISRLDNDDDDEMKRKEESEMPLVRALLFSPHRSV